MGLIVISSTSAYFEKVFDRLDCDNTTKAYIVSLFCRGITPKENSIVLAWAELKNTSKFDRFQELGDYAFWHTIVSESSNHVVYETIGSLAYHRCHRLLMGKWPLYEELADRFSVLTSESSKLLRQRR